MILESWPTLQALTSAVGPYHLDFRRAVQLRHFFHTLPAPGIFDRSLSPFEECCVEQGLFPHIILKMYSLLITRLEDYQLTFLQKWEVDLGRTFTRGQHTNV